MDFRPRRAARRPPIRRTRSPGTSSSTPPGRSRPGHRSVDPAVLRACIVAAAASKGITPRRRCSPPQGEHLRTEVSIFEPPDDSRRDPHDRSRPWRRTALERLPADSRQEGQRFAWDAGTRIRASGVQREVSSFSPAIE